jgi:RNA methyltransferase, TrmH family
MFSKSHIKYIQSLQYKKFRDEANCFIAETPKVVTALLLQKLFVCKQLFATAQWVQDNQQLLQNFSTVEIIVVKDFELQKISQLTTPNNVLAIFFKKNEVVKVDINNNITLVLDGIQDPGNMGSIIRSADWFGIKNIVCSINCVDMYNNKVVQSTMGSLGRVNIIYTNLIDWLQKNNTVPQYAAMLNGSDVQAFGKTKEAILIIGNEANGITDEVMQLQLQKITIPKYGLAESLNAGVATGILLSHFKG